MCVALCLYFSCFIYSRRRSFRFKDVSYCINLFVVVNCRRRSSTPRVEQWSRWGAAPRHRAVCTVNSKTVRSASDTAVRYAQNCEIGTNRTNFNYCIPYRCYPSSICVRIVHIPISYFVRCNCTAIFNILELALLWGVWTPRRDATLRYSRLRRRLLARSSKTPFYIDTDVILYFKQMSG